MKMCGDCKLFDRDSDGFGFCMWKPKNTPFFYDVQDPVKVYFDDGKKCNAFKPK